MELAGFLYTLTSLTVVPNRSQLFQYESLSLSCEENGKPSDWRVKARTDRGVSECGGDWGSVQTSTCVITEAYRWNSGEYWCEAPSGETSAAVNITITGNNVILESPVLPVTEGESVTLRCSTRDNSSRLQTSTFMKDRAPVEATLTGQMTLHAVSRSDEGLYMCMISGAGASLESWISVRDPSHREVELSHVPRLSFSETMFRSQFEECMSTRSNTPAAPDAPAAPGVPGVPAASDAPAAPGVPGVPAASDAPAAPGAPGAPAAPILPLHRLICLLVVGTLYLLSSVLLALIHRDRARAESWGGYNM